VAGTHEERLHWVKSSRSGADGCVEVAYGGPDTVHVRDSKDPDGAVLSFNAREWDAFIAAAGAGEFDRRCQSDSEPPGYAKTNWSRQISRRWLSSGSIAATQAAFNRSRTRSQTIAVASRRMLQKMSSRRAAPSRSSSRG